MIAIAADDDRIVPLPSPIEPRTLETERSPGPLQAPERILVVGWSCMGRAVFRSLAPFLSPGSSVLVAARPDLQGEWQPSELEALGLSVRHVDLSGDVGVLTRIVSEEHFDEIIVLGYRQDIGPSEADAQTMLTLMLLGDLVAKGDRSLAGTRIVGEILDSRRVDLARRARADDLVVSDRLAGSMIAQLAENPQLAPVFEDLFDADGATVTLRRIGLYANPGQEVTFGDLVHMAALRGDSAIGYRSARAAGGSGDAVVRLNPAKSDRFQVEPEDSLVVIGALR